MLAGIMLEKFFMHYAKNYSNIIINLILTVMHEHSKNATKDLRVYKIYGLHCASILLL